MKMSFNISGTLEVPDNAIPHLDAAGKLYALEFNDIMYMLQMCIVAEAGAGGYEIIHQFEEMENHNIKNVRYDEVNFIED